MQKGIPSRESGVVEFKSSFNTTVIECLVAFANTKGGVVYVGVSDGAEVKGVTLGKETVAQIINEIKGKTSPSLIPMVEILDDEGKKVLALSVSEYPIKPVSTQGRYYKRVGNSNHLMTTSEVVDMHLQTLNSSWDAYPDVLHDMDTISLEKVQKAIDRMRGRGRDVTEDPLSFLLKYNLIREGRPTNAAYLLFKREDCYLSTVELGFFQDDITIKDSDRSKSDLLTQVEEVMTFVRKHINKKVIITGEAENRERWDYPLEAIREIVMNMIVHRDYRSSADSIVKVYPDKIEFYNPGRLPEGVTVEALLSNTYRSQPRNKLIADFCKDLGLIEKYGSGVRRVIALFKSVGIPVPVFTEMSGGVNVTVFTSVEEIGNVTENVTDDVTESVEMCVDVTENVTESVEIDANVIENVTANVTENRLNRILELLKINPAITTTELAKQIGVSRMTIYRALEVLKSQDRVLRLGGDRGGRWNVMETED